MHWNVWPCTRNGREIFGNEPETCSIYLCSQQRSQPNGGSFSKRNFKQGRLFDYVITVCDETNDAKCPVFPGITQRLHWPFPDPDGLTGTEEEKQAALRQIRDQIKRRVEIWFSTVFSGTDVASK